MVAQSIHRPAGINAFGSYLVRIEPDFATLDFSVTRTEATAGEAFAKTRAGAADVRAFLLTANVSDADVSTSQISLQQAHEFLNGKQHPIGFVARIGFQVVLDDLDRLESVLGGAVETGANRVDSVTFRTRRMREVRADARRGAFAQARSKAELYATAGGVKVGQVLHVEDVNPEQTGRGHSNYAPDLDLLDQESLRAPSNPGSIVVSAAVMVCFAILS